MSLADQSAVLPNGLRAAYYDSGGSGGSFPEHAAIVLLHGFCGSSAYWEKVTGELAELGRLIVPDLRGHGRSSAPDDAVYRMESFAEDLALLLQRLQIGRVCLLGHSLGGYVSLAFAERYPDRLLSLGLVHSTAMPDSDEAKLNRDKAVNAIRTEGIRPFVRGLVPKLFAPAHRESMADRITGMTEVGYGTSPEGAAATALGMKERPDRRAVLERADVPRLLVAGSEDGLIPPDKTFTAEGPGVTRELLEGCGHMSMVEAPSALSERIAGFVRGTSMQ
jgi:pimeloyl-ACP methyl ester carboxylesterase